MKNFSDMIGIVPERILEYVHHVEEKEMAKSGRSEIVKKIYKSLALFPVNMKVSHSKYLLYIFCEHKNEH
jgi:hypothetical protein